jgi:DNA-directed RNA polymerase subunit RPC12/RpoP
MLQNISISMPFPISDNSQLLIRCPSCGQRFKIGQELRDRTVECGACDHRFVIHDDTIVRGPKIYPGERKDAGLNRYQRVPLAAGDHSEAMQEMRYGSIPGPAALEPISPQRVIAGSLGVALMAMVGLLLMFGNAPGGMLYGMVFTSRIIMAVFTGLLGVGLLVYANPHARTKSGLIALCFAAALITTPFVFREGSDIQHGNGVNSSSSLPPLATSAISKETEVPGVLALRSQIGTGPLVIENVRLSDSGTGKHAIGLWLRGMGASHRFLVRDYILRVSGADSSSHYYPRDGGDYLLVVTGITQSIGELADLTSRLGKVEHLYPELAVIEMRVNQGLFAEQAIDILSNRQDPNFYRLNKEELESIDLDRVKRAVQRLAEVEPKVYRSDISGKLVSLLGEDGLNFYDGICRALAVWSVEPGPASEAALKRVQKILDSNSIVPPEIISLIVKEKDLRVIPFLDRLWFKSPSDWESLYADLGPPIEASVIQRLPETQGMTRHSAVRVLGRVGSAESLPVLANAAVGADPELKVLLDKAEKSIRTRLGQ